MSGQEQIVSILGSAYFHPLAALTERLLELPPPDPSGRDGKVPSQENGYAAAICVLAAVCLESWVMRLRYFVPSHAAAQERFSIDFLKAVYPAIPNPDELAEVIVLRDLLAHNHVWEILRGWDDTYVISVQAATKDPMSGDKKYMKYVDLTTRKTRLLRLNILPTAVDRDDAKVVLNKMWSALMFFESQDKSLVFVSHTPFMFRGKKSYFERMLAQFGGDT